MLYAVRKEVDETADKLADVVLDDASETEERKHQSRGGRALPKDEAKRLEKEEQKRKVLALDEMAYAWEKAKVVISMVERNRRKAVTHIRGLEFFGLDLKQVAKRCASKFACGCSVARNPAGFDEVVIQGDFVDDLVDFIPDEWSEVPSEQIEACSK